MSAEIGKCTLKPGETCLMCGHTAPKPEPKKKPACKICGLAFKRGEKWRLYRGNRIHTVCTPDHVVIAPAKEGEKPSPAPMGEVGKPLPKIPEFTCENCIWDGQDENLTLSRRCKACAGRLGVARRKQKQSTP